MARGARRFGLALLAVALAGPVDAQTLGGGGDLEIPFLRIAAALIVGILIAIGAALLLKRHLGAGIKLPSLFSLQATGRASRQIKVQETHRLSPHADLCRFSVSSREYLVIVSAHGTEVLNVSEGDDSGKAQPPAAARQ
ncbi:MAG TPA: hypothetical protein VGO52_06250 [Hyphomonadaceae bacterium]|nr:hypothetical protein [Hyphomonadaceae bacterium]